MIQTIEFWLFVAVGVLVYWRLPVAWRASFLAALSCAYLAILQWEATLAVVAWVVAFWWSVKWAGRQPGRRYVIVALVCSILLYLGWFKYLPVLLDALTRNSPAAIFLVPLGLSYFTFKLIHYAVEMRRGTIPSHKFVDFLSYMLLFPIFTAGPIERFEHYLANRHEQWERSFLVEGLTRIVHGLIKKMVIAGMVLIPLQGIIIGAPEGNTALLLARLDGLSAGSVWLYCLLTYFIIYMDFSAYSDIAIGTSRLFGIRIMENFNLPIIASNMADFWKRWHMTLAGWCQTYIYMPVFALTRQPYMAVYSTFIVMGLWHGASWNWLAWGLYHATGVSVALTWARIKRRLDWPARPGMAYRWLGVILTLLYVAGAAAFTSTDHVGGIAAAGRIWGALLGIRI